MDWKEGQGSAVPVGGCGGPEGVGVGVGMECPAASPIPTGLEALYAKCRSIYPDQPNPLQVTALVKYW